MLMPFGIRLPHLELLTAISSKYLVWYCTYVCMDTDEKSMDSKFGARGGNDGWLGYFWEARSIRWGAT